MTGKSQPVAVMAALLALSVVSGMYLAPHPTWGLVAVAAVGALVVLGRLDGWRRLYAITVVLLFCAASSQERLAEIGYYSRYAAAAALAMWSCLQYRRQAVPYRLLGVPQQLLITGLWLCTAMAVCSTAWSVDPLATVQQSIALIMLTTTVHGLATRRWADGSRIAGDVAVTFGLLTATFVASLAADALGVPDTRVFNGRFQGLYSNPNMLGMVAVLAVPLGWGLYRHTGRKLYLLALSPAIIAMVMSQSRTAIVATIVGALWVILRIGPAAVARILGLAVAGTVVVELSGVAGRSSATALIDSLVLRFTADRGSDGLSGRTVAWHFVVDLMQNRPTTGYGYAAGPTVFQNMRDAGVLAFDPDTVHNSYLQWVLELGLIGLAPMVVVLAVFGWVLFRGDLGGVGFGLVWAVVAGSLLQLTESAMFGTGQAYPYIFWLATAGAVTWSRRRLRPTDPAGKDQPRRAATLIS